MYSVIELAKMYDVTRATIYKYLKDESLQEFIMVEGQGQKLRAEGLNVLNVLLAQNSTKKADKDIESVNVYKEIIDEKNKHIQALEDTIKELKHDKERLYEELREQRAMLTNANNKGFFKRLFG